jgi:cyclopropane fatty-acyl-phospholipid synthase-like methyltransferase
MKLSQEEQEAASKSRFLYSRAWKIYELFFFRLLGYRRAAEALLSAEVHLKSENRVLDAGSGTGLLTRALYRSSMSEGLESVRFHSFDLTPEVIDGLEAWISKTGASGIETAVFNVLDLSVRPEGWGQYDQIVSSAMMEYLPRSSLAAALKGLGSLLNENGKFFLIITRANPITNLIVGRLWRSNLYTRTELAGIIEEAGFKQVHFKEFPGLYKWFGKFMIAVEMN